MESSTDKSIVIDLRTDTLSLYFMTLMMVSPQGWVLSQEVNTNVSWFALKIFLIFNSANWERGLWSLRLVLRGGGLALNAQITPNLPSTAPDTTNIS